MKNNCILLILFWGWTFTGNAFKQQESLPGFYLHKTVNNPGIKNGEATIKLDFNGDTFLETPPGYQTIIYYSVNNLIDTLFLDSSLSATLQLKAGKTVFKFWAGPGYNEVITDSIAIQNQTMNEAIVSFSSYYQRIQVDKPVIYLQSPVQLDFSLRVNPSEEFSFTYPPYQDQWKGTVHPNGAIEIRGQTYPYLFWDAKQDFELKKHSNGYRVSKQEVIPFLEKQLAHAGLTSTEKTDFITFWGPRMTQYDAVFVQFYVQEACDQFAQISCIPEPEAINRLYMGFSEWNDTFTPYLLPAELPAFKRTGFNLLEWGGFELKSNEL